MQKGRNSQFKEAEDSTSMIAKLIRCCFSNPSHVEAKKEGSTTRSRDPRRSCEEKPHRPPTRKRIPTTSLFDDESHIYGRQKDKEAVLGLLLNGEVSSDDRVSVVTICGEEGVGKTTLAQLVYRDAENSFDSSVWVFVPEDYFDVVKITKTILQAISKETWNLSDDLDLLQVNLRQILTGKRCLIVLDNVWNLDYEQWDLVCKPFAAVASRVKIVVTTQNKNISSIMGVVSPYNLDVLSDEDCLSVFAHHALAEAKFAGNPYLRQIGEKIARQCKGLPGAAKLYGGKLRGKNYYDEWGKNIKLGSMGLVNTLGAEAGKHEHD